MRDNSRDHILPTSSVQHRLSTWNLFTLSLGMAGAQVAWTVELGYGTPFLLSLGLSEQLTSLVWLAGPISGIVAQPLIGAISDNSISRYRRRYWIAWSTLVMVVSCLALAYATSIAEFFLYFFMDDWDPERNKKIARVAIGIAVTAFYLLDFSLNALQASLRNLLLDVTPPQQLSAGNAWHGRMTHAGNILGYGFGFINLSQWPILRSLGGNQFRKLCVVGIIIIVITVWVTCWTQDEPEYKINAKESSSSNGLKEVFCSIRTAVFSLPINVKKVCFVQLFAFMAWFPFLFYATTYVGQVMARQNNKEPDVDEATRMGNFAFLLYSIIGVIAGALLPRLAKRDRRLLPDDYTHSEEERFAHIQRSVIAWKRDSEALGKPFHLPRMPTALRDIWCFALVFYFFITLWTFAVTTVVEAVIAVALVGICWAIVVWAPFAIIMEFLKELDKEQETVNPDLAGPGENTSLLHQDARSSGPESTQRRVPGGTVLGIHNLSISFPQFIVALVSSLIFRIVDSTNHVIDEPNNIYLGKNGVAWVLRFGGMCALFGALATRLVPPTQQERMMRDQLRLIKQARETL